MSGVLLEYGLGELAVSRALLADRGFEKGRVPIENENTSR